MTMMLLTNMAYGLVFGSIAGLMLFLLLYPLSVYLLARRNTLQSTLPYASQDAPVVYMLIPVRNGQALIEAKMTNCLQLNYPADKLQFIVISDGSDDDTVATLQRHADPRIQVLTSVEHIGKANALNAGFAKVPERCDIVVLSDADALLEPDSLMQLIQPFQQASIGGVSGLRRSEQVRQRLSTEAQNQYIQLDSWIKQQESAFGSVTGNDGKLYAIRRNLWQPVMEGVTDDLYMALTVIGQGARFIFVADAIAYIKPPARSVRHEIQRRRRVTCRSLRGIRCFIRPLWTMPASRGYLIRLLINKGLRRLMPFFLLGLLLGSAVLYSAPLFEWLLYAQLTAYSVAIAQLGLRHMALPKTLSKCMNAWLYFVVGNVGMAFGVIDYCRGKTILKWEPVKHDQSDTL